MASRFDRDDYIMWVVLSSEFDWDKPVAAIPVYSDQKPSDAYAVLKSTALDKFPHAAYRWNKYDMDDLFAPTDEFAKISINGVIYSLSIVRPCHPGMWADCNTYWERDWMYEVARELGEDPPKFKSRWRKTRWSRFWWAVNDILLGGYTASILTNDHDKRD